MCFILLLLVQLQHVSRKKTWPSVVIGRHCSRPVVLNWLSLRVHTFFLRMKWRPPINPRHSNLLHKNGKRNHFLSCGQHFLYKYLHFKLPRKLWANPNSSATHFWGSNLGWELLGTWRFNSIPSQRATIQLIVINHSHTSHQLRNAVCQMTALCYHNFWTDIFMRILKRYFTILYLHFAYTKAHCMYEASF